MLSFVFIKPICGHKHFEEALIGDDPEELLRYSAPLERAFAEIKEWTNTEGCGRVLSAFGNQIVIQIPAEKILKLTEFAHKYEYTAKTQLAIGIGINPSEAFKAMGQSELEGGHRVVLYSSELDTEGYGDPIENDEDLSKAGYDISFPNLHKEDMEFKSLIDQTASTPKPEEGQPVPQQVQSQQGQAPQGQTQARSSQDYAGPTDGQKQSTKQKVLEALSLVKHYSVDIMRLKEINPKAFDAIKKLIDSMVKMAQTHGEMVKSEGDAVGSFLELLMLLKAERLEKAGRGVGFGRSYFTGSGLNKGDFDPDPLDALTPIDDAPAPMQTPQLPQAPKSQLHNTFAGFVGGLKSQTNPGAKLSFITQHINHQPFIQAMSAHPEGPKIMNNLRSLLDSKTNAPLTGRGTKVNIQGTDKVIKEELPPELPPHQNPVVLDKSLQGHTVPVGHRTGDKVKMANGHWHQGGQGMIMGSEGVPQSPKRGGKFQ
jgi:hypothetical protein